MQWETGCKNRRKEISQQEQNLTYILAETEDIILDASISHCHNDSFQQISLVSSVVLAGY